MSYNNYRPTGGNYSRGGYNGGGNGGYNGGGSFQNQYNNSSRDYRSRGQGSYSQPAKKSGCKIKSSYVRRSTGETVNAPCITGWKKFHRGPFVKFIAVPNADPSTKKDRWKKFIVKIQAEGQTEQVTTGFWDVDKKVLRMPDYSGGFVANPSGGPGGYWGRSGPPRNNNRR